MEKKGTMTITEIVTALRKRSKWKELATLVKESDQETRMKAAALMQKLNPRWKEPVTLNSEEEELLRELFDQLPK